MTLRHRHVTKTYIHINIVFRFCGRIFKCNVADPGPDTDPFPSLAQGWLLAALGKAATSLTVLEALAGAAPALGRSGSSGCGPRIVAEALQRRGDPQANPLLPLRPPEPQVLKVLEKSELGSGYHCKIV